jgi:hypothetical protein
MSNVTFAQLVNPGLGLYLGASTGGWMTLAQQISYPDYFGGAWGFCPDPVDFHALQMVNLYTDRNAHYDEGPFASMPKLFGRLPNDRILATMEQSASQDVVLGSHGRSGSQLYAWQTTFGPVGADGYPAPLWDPKTGNINPAVARYWTEHYDLTALLRSKWKSLGPKLVGRVHVTIGTKDTFYLDDAARRMKAFLESTNIRGNGPYYGGTFEFGNDEPHCYIGQIPEGMPIFTHYIPIFTDHIRTAAPKGADVETCRRR